MNTTTILPTHFIYNYFSIFSSTNQPSPPKLTPPRKGSSSSLDILPSSDRSIGSNSEGIKAQAISDIATGHGSILSSSKHLPLVTLVRASHEARSTGTGESPAAEGLAGSVLEGAGGRASGDVGRVGDGEGQGAAGGDVDLLAAGDFDVLFHYFISIWGSCVVLIGEKRVWER